MRKEKIKASAAFMWLCWFIYASSYLGKVNYAANINQIMDFFKVDHSSAGLASTFFFFAYAIGQVVNGLFCKKYNVKWMIFISLLVSSCVNLCVGISSSFAPIKYLWLLNGFAMSILWPCLIRTLSENLSKKDMPKASVTMGTTVATGTFLIYALSALFVKINFKLSFYLPATMFLVAALVWIFTYPSLVKRANEESQQEEEEEIVTEKAVQATAFNKPLLLLSIVMLAIYGIATNLIKDGLTTWVPSILKEQYQLDSSFSIILTLALPMVALFGNIFAVKLHKKIPDYVLHVAVLFLCSGAIIGGVIAGLSLNQFVLTLLGFTVVCWLVSSSNSLITSIFPLFMKGKVNSGLIAGILNGFCYLGSTLSSYGLGAIADYADWNAVFWVLFSVCIIVCVGAVVYLLIKRKLQDADSRMKEVA